MSPISAAPAVAERRAAAAGWLGVAAALFWLAEPANGAVVSDADQFSATAISGDAADYDWLIAAIGDAPFVLLG